MTRNLSDVLDYFLPPKKTPETAASQETRPHGPAARTETREREPRRPFPKSEGEQPLQLLPILALPMGDRDVVRAAFTWNLAVEIARLGGRARILTPDLGDPSPLWPEPGMGPLGTELMPVVARDLGSLYRIALESAVIRHRGSDERAGVVFVRVPPAWLLKPGEGAPLLRWSLLFSSSRARDLKESYGLSKLILGAQPEARLGVTVHGAPSLREGEEAFNRLAQASEKGIGRELLRYGLLVDDLHVYRAIVAQRPIGLAHPQAPAARALRDVARRLMHDAGSPNLV
jgi:hypothetical protein